MVDKTKEANIITDLCGFLGNYFSNKEAMLTWLSAINITVIRNLL